jgi:hypothetical protein
MSEPRDKADTALTTTYLNYVWDWWKFHAKQRTDTFNYFLIITGILANAYVSLVREHQHLAFGIAGLGASTSIGFLLLDVRNRRQLARATPILQEIEAKKLRGDDLPREPLANIKEDLFLIKHWFIFRGIEGLVFAGWLLSLKYINVF